MADNTLFEKQPSQDSERCIIVRAEDHDTVFVRIIGYVSANTIHLDRDDIEELSNALRTWLEGVKE